MTIAHREHSLGLNQAPHAEIMLYQIQVLHSLKYLANNYVSQIIVF